LRMKTAVKILPLLIFAFVLVIFAGCKTLCSKPDSVDLFNGKDFSGWTFCMRSNSDPMLTWSVENGLMHCTGQPYGYARTTKIYHDYKLTVIWRFIKVAPHADNSGIFVHIQPPDKVFPECVECQGQYQHQGDIILGRGASADGHPSNPQKSTVVRQMYPQNEFPAGEWGTNVVICSGSTIQLYVNGKMMNKVTGCNISSGFVGIQSEGGDVEVRRILLEPLK